MLDTEKNNLLKRQLSYTFQTKFYPFFIDEIEKTKSKGRL